MLTLFDTVVFHYVKADCDTLHTYAVSDMMSHTAARPLLIRVLRNPN